ncbi:hypothetical protein [Peribacillus sp. NPDC096448]|uniref:hypothetical protein n=1 Tax=Peribacillus sp. NPDC096448 TaxID=3364395 RepID=UPI0037F9517C
MKKFIYVLIIVVVVALIVNVYINKDDVTTNNNGETRGERIAAVLNTGFDEYGLFSFEIGDTDPTIRIIMDKAKNEQELREYIEENVSKSDLSHYNLEILQRSLQEVEREHTMLQIEGIVMEYIKEKNYTDVQVHYPIEPDPVLKITINETSERSSEDLKTELDNLLASKHSELLLKDISYEIQVIKS